MVPPTHRESSTRWPKCAIQIPHLSKRKGLLHGTGSSTAAKALTDCGTAPSSKDILIWLTLPVRSFSDDLSDVRSAQDPLMKKHFVKSDFIAFSPSQAQEWKHKPLEVVVRATPLSSQCPFPGSELARSL